MVKPWKFKQNSASSNSAFNLDVPSGIYFMNIVIGDKTGTATFYVK